MILAGIDIYAVNRLSEIQEGKPVSEALALKNKAVVEALDGLPAHKIHCSVLAEEAIKKALQDYYEKAGNIAHIDGAMGLDPVFEAIVDVIGE